MGIYNHTQGSASTTWTITHNLNNDTVNIDVIIDNSGSIEKAIPQSVVIDSVNQVTVTLSSSKAGFARVIG